MAGKSKYFQKRTEEEKAAVKAEPPVEAVEDSSMDPVTVSPAASHVAEKVFSHPADVAKELLGGRDVTTIAVDTPPDHFATFVSLKGRHHKITIKPLDNIILETKPGMGRLVSVPKSGKEAQFEEGMFTTSDPEIIASMLKIETGLTLDYDINPDDPTGFWERMGIVTLEEVRVTRIKERANPEDLHRIFTGRAHSAMGEPVTADA